MVILLGLLGTAQGVEPFLFPPFQGARRLNSAFDHRAQLLQADGRQLASTGSWRPGPSGHRGLDWGLPAGTPVLSAAGGVVTKAEDVGPTRCGRRTVDRDLRVEITHRVEGVIFTTLYLHLSALRVERGARVAPGQRIGLSGNTGCSSGPHLHFEVRREGHPVDPYGWSGTFVDPSASEWLWRRAPRVGKKEARPSLSRDGG